jgi:two-component system response regulator DevR
MARSAFEPIGPTRAPRPVGRYLSIDDLHGVRQHTCGRIDRLRWVPVKDRTHTVADELQSETIRVLIVDDHHVVALGLKALLDEEDDIEVVALANDVRAAVAATKKHNPDVLLMDYRLPDGTGAEAAAQIRNLEGPPNVVMVTAVADRRVLGQALDAGCTGFVSKNADGQDLIDAIRAAASNESYFTPDMLKHLVHLRRFEQVDGAELSDREREVLQLTADGLSPDQIASTLFLSSHTVKNHVRHAMAKLDAHTKLEAVVKAVRARIISIDN